MGSCLLYPIQIKRLREEGEMYKQAHAKKKQQVKDLEAEIDKSKGQILEITGSDMQQTLMEKSLLQRDKASLQAALTEKDRQASA